MPLEDICLALLIIIASTNDTVTIIAMERWAPGTSTLSTASCPTIGAVSRLQVAPLLVSNRVNGHAKLNGRVIDWIEVHKREEQ